MSVLHLDFETRSTCDLRKRGLHVYAADPSTSILCMAYAFDDEPVQLSKMSDPFPERVTDHIRSGGLVYAHNGCFEREMWNAKLGPDLRVLLEIEQMRCTMVMGYAMGLPGTLADAAAALGLPQRKDAKGQRVMLQISKPRRIEDDGTVIWWDDPAKLEILYAYCRQDVEVERALHHRLVELSDSEQRLWFLDQSINNRGVRVDLEAIDQAIELVAVEKTRLDKRMRKVTGGAVATCTATGQLTDWLRAQGLVAKGVAKADVAELLTHDDLPAEVQAALLLRQEAAKSSTAKLVAMRERAGADGRVRGGLQFHGASTGRWAARGIQMQNLPRPTIVKEPEHVEDVFAHLDDRDYLDVMYGSPMQVVSDVLRGFIVASEGHELAVCDYSNIEGRVLAWLAGEEWKLQAYRDFDSGTGPDLYLVSASRIKRCTIDEAKPFRQVGKTAELACGYQGGVGAFQKMASAFGLQLTDEEADLVKIQWREAHPAIVQFWKDMEFAAVRAVRNGGEQRARGIRFKKSGSFLWCQLPSKRVLCYPYPEVHDKEMPWSTPEKPVFRPALTYMTVNSITRKWERISAYGGYLTENVTQAVARDLLADALVKCDAAGLDVVFHVHDEIVVDAPKSARVLDTLTNIMTDTPKWAAGLPVAVAGYTARRYRK